MSEPNHACTATRMPFPTTGVPGGYIYTNTSGLTPTAAHGKSGAAAPKPEPAKSPDPAPAARAPRTK